jgi:hypothetical protein
MGVREKSFPTHLLQIKKKRQGKRPYRKNFKEKWEKQQMSWKNYISLKLHQRMVKGWMAFIQSLL